MVARRPLQGTVDILRYNWHFYLFGLIGIAALSVGMAVVRLPPVVTWVALAVLAPTAWWLLASIAASWWVYDASELMSWKWLTTLFPDRPARWVSLHAGLDESSAQLSELWGPPKGVFDFFDACNMTEPSIRRARALGQDPSGTPVSYRALPLPDGSVDLVCVIFAAHELRSPGARDAFFDELNRILASGGKLLLVEHVRDLANFVAFGPGFFHFMPDREWRRLGAGYQSRVYGNVTPFVRYYIWEKA